MTTWQGTLDNVPLGKSAVEKVVVSGASIDGFIAIAGSSHPIHTSDEWTQANTRFPRRIAHGMLIHALMSRPLARMAEECAVKTALVTTSAKYIRPVFADDEITVTLTVADKMPERQRFRVAAEAKNQHGLVVMVGEAIEQVID